MAILSKKSRILMFVIATVFALLIVHVATNGQISNTSLHKSPYEYNKLSAEERQKVIQDHAEWLKVYENVIRGDEALKDERRADLSGAGLRGADLSGANLSGANLRGADLRGADLRGADLNGAKLSEANLYDADLEEADLFMADLYMANLYMADLEKANLSGANLRGANLRGADLSVANLNGVDLGGADLSKAKLSGANLSGANLRGAILSGAILKWDTQKKEYIYALLGAKGLSNIRISDDLTTIVDVRKMLKEVGFKNEEKSLTSAIRKYQLRHSWPERLFTTIVLGGLVTDFGANPAGALLPLLALIFVFVWFYFLAVRRSREAAAIWRIRPENRLIRDVGESDREPVKWGGFCRTLLTAFYFSFLSAFYFGWRELNISNWMVRIQKKEYTLQATGWVRTVSGIQSLISLYLVALFLLTYFGSPFE